MIIYKTTNLINGKIYIGKENSNNPKYLGSGLLLKRSIIKYGIENFKKEIIQICQSKDELNLAEIHWIKEYNSFTPNGYNIAMGGMGGDTISNNPNNSEIRTRISNAKKSKNFKHSDYSKNLISIANTGKRPSDYTRSKISDALLSAYDSGKKVALGLKGNKNPMFGISMKQRLIDKHGTEIGLEKYEEFKNKKTIDNSTKNPMKGKHFTKIWIEKYGEEIANKMIEEKYKQIGTKLKERNVNPAERKKHGSKGKLNPMYGKSVYDVWLKKYGKDVADAKMIDMKKKMQTARKNKKLIETEVKWDLNM